MPLIDMHVHIQNRSPCSILSTNQLLTYISPKLQGVCITDHFHVNPIHNLTRGLYGQDLKVYFGVEITSKEGDILAYGISAVPSRNLSAEAVVDSIHKQGGVAVAAHPYSPRHLALGDKVFDLDLDGVELNGSLSTKHNKEAKMAAEIMNLPTTGGSDAHSQDQLNTMATWFENPVTSIDDIVEAIKDKTCEAKRV